MLKAVKRLAVLGVLVLFGLIAWNLFGFGHSIVNGSQIFAEVSEIRAGVPPNASHVQAQSSGAVWISGCSEIPGSRDGWTTDQVSVSFTDSDSRTTIIQSIDRALKKGGWRRHDASPGAGSGLIPHWTLDVKLGHLVQAWAFPVGPSTRHWYVSSSWSPPGPYGQGCP